jgi:hypothetical protein
MGAAAAAAIAAGAIAAAPAGAALAPVHNPSKLEHVIHQKQKELARAQARAHAMHEVWLRMLAHREQQKQNLLERWEAIAAACQAAPQCSDTRNAHVGEEEERLSGEIQADQTLAAGPEDGIRAFDRVHQLEEQIKQREAELAIALSAAPAGKR